MDSEMGVKTDKTLEIEKYLVLNQNKAPKVREP
jgi:hypothetical protein